MLSLLEAVGRVQLVAVQYATPSAAGDGMYATWRPRWRRSWQLIFQRLGAKRQVHIPSSSHQADELEMVCRCTYV